MEGQKPRVILVHGSCHGAWVWYKVVAGLASTGHSATAIDLGGSGIDSRRIPQDVSSIFDYSQPLMDLMASLSSGEKVILVGHSFGGIILSLAMETFPEKIAAAVFVTAFMPDTDSRPSHVLEKFNDEKTRTDSWLMDTDVKVVAVPGRAEPVAAMLFGPQFMLKWLYQRCTAEDLSLARSLVRTASHFLEDLRRMPVLSKERYGSVDKVFIVCAQDAALTEHYQRWMLRKIPMTEVMEIEDADHMPMLSMPRELCRLIASIANKYARNLISQQSFK